MKTKSSAGCMSFRPQINSDPKPTAARQASCLCSTGTHSGLFCLNQGHVHEMFAQEPYLLLIGAEHLTHNQVVRAVIPELSCTARKDSNLTYDDLMSVNQARQLNRNFFSTARWSFNLGRFRDIGCHRQTHTSKRLNPF